MNDVYDIALLNACSLKQCIKMFDVCNCVLGNLFEVDLGFLELYECLRLGVLCLIFLKICEQRVISFNL